MYLGVMLDSKLCFHCHVDLTVSQRVMTLGLIPFIIYNFTSIGSLLVLYIALIKSKLNYASILWNKRISTDSNEIKYVKKSANLKVSFLIRYFM